MNTTLLKLYEFDNSRYLCTYILIYIYMKILHKVIKVLYSLIKLFSITK